ncbi:MAG: LytR C-terminal domain-containing protein [Bifidobacteriaceae bacterium]|nr:LytR C-terminal domain-containing protein [Bifidobacteriaceae bacterium]
MAKKAYPYPPDEFDRVDLSSRPKEIHAARRGPWSRAWPFLLVIVLIPAIAFAVVFFLGDMLPGGKSDADKAGDSSRSTSQTPPPEQDATPEEPPPPVEPTEQVVTPEPPPVVDKAVKVTVYNTKGGTRGAAATAAETLQGLGYTAAAVNTTPFEDTPSGSAVPAAATVYYSTAEQSATAADVASSLSITTTPELNAQIAGGGVVVVLK